MVRVRMVVEGEVQGVGFRAYVRRSAAALGVSGTVWNREDGRVELIAEGDRMTLERLVAAVRAGSPASAVAAVRTTWSEGPARHAGFTIGRGAAS